MLHPIIGALLIAVTLTAYTVHTILSYEPRHARTDDMPTKEFLASFATPPKVAQDLGHDRQAYARAFGHALLAQADASLAMAQEWSQTLTAPMHVPATVIGRSSIDWAQEAEDSLLHTRHGVYVPTGAEFDAAEAQNIAAKVEDAVPAKRVRVYALAEDCGVSSKFLRGVLENGFGIATKSPSSTVSATQAAEVREFFHTHLDV